MAKREIVWSNLAKLELQNTIEFYFERNGNANYSLQLLDEIEDLTNTLQKIILLADYVKINSQESYQ